MAQDLTTNRTKFLRIGVLCSAIALSAALVQFAWAAAFHPIPEHAPVRKAAPSLTAAALQLPEGRPFEPDALLNRPVFSPTRTRSLPIVTPPAPDQSVQAETPPPPPAIVPPTYLVGGVIVARGKHRALLRTEKREKGRWFAQGETTAEGWRLASVEPNAMVLERGGHSFTLPLQGRTSAD